jgi:hypothetical protein
MVQIGTPFAFYGASHWLPATRETSRIDLRVTELKIAQVHFAAFSQALSRRNHLAQLAAPLFPRVFAQRSDTADQNSIAVCVLKHMTSVTAIPFNHREQILQFIYGHFALPLKSERLISSRRMLYAPCQLHCPLIVVAHVAEPNLDGLAVLNNSLFLVTLDHR